MKLALIGDCSDGGFAALRTGWFARALPKATVLDWRDPHLAEKAAPANAIITAGIYGPTRAGLAIAEDRPLWLDLPGDPFADAQAAASMSEPEVVAREAEMVFGTALRRGDAFSTISQRAGWALRGQLGLLGRLSRLPPGVDPVFLLPVPYQFPQPEGETTPEDGTLRVGLCGSFNAWFDEETLAEGLLLAARSGPLEVTVVGGGVPGHHEAGLARFQRRVLASPYAASFHFLPTVTEAELPRVLASSTVGICLDRPGFEPLFGSRTRLLFYLWLGKRVIATSLCELAQDLAAAGYLQAVPPGDAQALAQALHHPLPLPDRSFLHRRFPLDLEPLQRWAAAPHRLPPHPEAEPLRHLLAERDALRNELASLRASPTFRMLNRLRRG